MGNEVLWLPVLWYYWGEYKKWGNKCWLYMYMYTLHIGIVIRYNLFPPAHTYQICWAAGFLLLCINCTSLRSCDPFSVSCVESSVGSSSEIVLGLFCNRSPLTFLWTLSIFSLLFNKAQFKQTNNGKSEPVKLEDSISHLWNRWRELFS